MQRCSKNNLTLEELIQLEGRYGFWRITLFDYPLWSNIRPHFVANAILLPPPIKKVQLRAIISGLFDLASLAIKSIFNRRVFPRVWVFIPNRIDQTEAIKYIVHEEKIVFLTFETDQPTRLTHIRAELFFAIRVFLRIFPSRLFLVFIISKMRMVEIALNKPIERSILRDAIGDALFCKLLWFIAEALDLKIIYSTTLIPPGAKLEKKLAHRLVELQHGIIHPQHFGYVGLPESHQTIIVYNSKYENFLRSIKFSTKIQTIEFKTWRQTKCPHVLFPVVIFTQPNELVQNQISYALKNFSDLPIYLQRHPRDWYYYEIDESRFIQVSKLHEVAFPVLHSTTLIEDFLMAGKQIWLFSGSADSNPHVRFLTQGYEAAVHSYDGLSATLQAIRQELTKQEFFKEKNLG